LLTFKQVMKIFRPDGFGTPKNSDGFIIMRLIVFQQTASIGRSMSATMLRICEINAMTSF
jgi:hypothetical protein